jgi:exopolysaccharide production protein ExoZ
MKTIQSIQYLRAIAALLVVVYHAVTRAHMHFGMGAAGVDIFFIISGFIMWKISETESDPRRFLIRRIIRIVPLYWAVTCFIAACAIFLPGKIFPNIVVNLGFFVKSLFFVPYSNATGDIYPILVPGWTLNFEMAFYLVFAGCLFAPRKWQLPIMTLVMLTAVLLRVAFASSNPLFVTYTNPIILEFLVGAWLAEGVNRGLKLPMAVSVALVVCGGGALITHEVLRIELDPLLRAVWWGGAAFLIVSGAITLELAGWMPKVPLLKQLGDASYSIYLLHGLVVAAILLVFRHAAPAVLIIAVMVTSSVVGYASFRLFERPVGSWLRRRVEEREAPVPQTETAPANSSL